MTELTFDTTQCDRLRNRHVLSVQRVRRPLALFALVLAVIAMVQNVLGQHVPWVPQGVGPQTHPATAVCILILTMDLVAYRPFQRRASWRFALVSFGLAFVLGTLTQRAMDWGLGSAATPPGAYGLMGADTAAVLALLFAATLLRPLKAWGGLGCLLAALTFLFVAALCFSFGVPLFEGQMALPTFAALCLLALSVLTTYAYLPMLRPALVSGPVGLQTRITMLTGFLVPWSGGMVLYHLVGVPHRAFPIEALVISGIIASSAIVGLVSARYNYRQLLNWRHMSRELTSLACVDHLTGALNRSGIDQEFSDRWDSFQSTMQSQCVIMLDLDHFKQINDRFGHPEGDRVLRAIGQLLRPYLRSTDALCRWGGEEFLIVASGLTTPEAEGLANRMRQAVFDLQTFLSEQGGGTRKLPYRVTASFGIAFFEDRDSSPDAAIKRADAALYRAKLNGRNKVAVAPKTKKTAA